MTRLALKAIAVAALLAAGVAHAAMRTEGMGGEAAAPSPAPVAADASIDPPAAKPAAREAQKPKPAAEAERAADEGGSSGSSTPDWRALIPGSLRTP